MPCGHSHDAFQSPLKARVLPFLTFNMADSTAYQSVPPPTGASAPNAAFADALKRAKEVNEFLVNILSRYLFQLKCFFVGRSRREWDQLRLRLQTTLRITYHTRN